MNIILLKKTFIFVVIALFACYCAKSDEVLYSSESGNSQFIVAAETKKCSSGSELFYHSKIYAQVIDAGKKDTIWEATFPNPAYSGTGKGLLEDFKICRPSMGKEILIILSVINVPLKVVRINHDEKISVQEYLFTKFKIWGKQKISLVQNNNLLFLGINDNKNPDRKYECAYDTTANMLLDISSSVQLLYPYCPWELCLYRNFDKIHQEGNTVKLSANEFFRYYNLADVWAERENAVFISRFRAFLAHYELQVFGNMMKAQNKTAIIEELRKRAEQMDFSAINLKTLLNAELNNKNPDNIEKLIFLYQVSQSIERWHMSPEEITVSEEEINNFYHNYEWVFLKENKTDLVPLKDVRNFIITEIRRLKYFHLDELLIKTPPIEINWTD